MAKALLEEVTQYYRSLRMPGVVRLRMELDAENPTVRPLNSLNRRRWG